MSRRGGNEDGWVVPRGRFPHPSRWDPPRHANYRQPVIHHYPPPPPPPLYPNYIRHSQGGIIYPQLHGEKEEGEHRQYPIQGHDFSSQLLPSPPNGRLQASPNVIVGSEKWQGTGRPIHELENKSNNNSNNADSADGVNVVNNIGTLPVEETVPIYHHRQIKEEEKEEETTIEKMDERAVVEMERATLEAEYARLRERAFEMAQSWKISESQDHHRRRLYHNNNNNKQKRDKNTGGDQTPVAPPGGRLLGKGGYGAVWAVDNDLVVKKVRSHIALLQEAAAATRMRGTERWIVGSLWTEYASRQMFMRRCAADLRFFAAFVRLKTRLGELSPEVATYVRCKLALDVSRGVAAIHACGCLHSDLSAHNVLIRLVPHASRAQLLLSPLQAQPQQQQQPHEKLAAELGEMEPEALVSDIGLLAPKQHARVHLSAIRERTVASDEGHDCFCLGLILLELFFGQERVRALLYRRRTDGAHVAACPTPEVAQAVTARLFQEHDKMYTAAFESGDANKVPPPQPLHTKINNNNNNYNKKKIVAAPGDPLVTVQSRRNYNNNNNNGTHGNNSRQGEPVMGRSSLIVLGRQYITWLRTLILRLLGPVRERRPSALRTARFFTTCIGATSGDASFHAFISECNNNNNTKMAEHRLVDSHNTSGGGMGANTITPSLVKRTLGSSVSPHEGSALPSTSPHEENVGVGVVGGGTVAATEEYPVEQVERNALTFLRGQVVRAGPRIFDAYHWLGRSPDSWPAGSSLRAAAAEVWRAESPPGCVFVTDKRTGRPRCTTAAAQPHEHDPRPGALGVAATGAAANALASFMQRRLVPPHMVRLGAAAALAISAAVYGRSIYDRSHALELASLKKGVTPRLFDEFVDALVTDYEFVKRLFHM